MSASWIVREPGSAGPATWSVRTVSGGEEIVTHSGLSPREAKLAMYRLMYGLDPVESMAGTLTAVTAAERVAAPVELATAA
jgi:hypothetical protein